MPHVAQNVSVRLTRRMTSSVSPLEPWRKEPKHEETAWLFWSFALHMVHLRIGLPCWVSAEQRHKQRLMQFTRWRRPGIREQGRRKQRGMLMSSIDRLDCQTLSRSGIVRTTNP